MAYKIVRITDKRNNKTYGTHIVGDDTELLCNTYTRYDHAKFEIIGDLSKADELLDCKRCKKMIKQYGLK